MSEHVLSAPRAASATREPILSRRVVFLGLVATITAVLIGAAAAVLAPGGWTALKTLFMACFAVNAPWLALGFATSVVGFFIRMTHPDPNGLVLPALRAVPEDAPVRAMVGCAVCVRNEAIGPIADRLAALIEAADDAGVGERFVACVLSDTADPSVAVEEEAEMETLRARIGAGRVRYRRRSVNTGWKAGNVMDFLDRHADGLELMLCLDADSEMELPTVLRMARVMQTQPKLAILQATIAGTPARAAFPRLFQFGHRAGSRIWATGQAWWQGDQGPYWGHNALLRIAAFRADARLAPLPDGTPVLSHDHVEAAQLQGAGWAVRVLPDDTGSRETQPTNLPDFLRRDVRWAAGNMQYRHLLRRRELSLVGRFQMLQAILHYALTPAWFAMLPLTALIAATGESAALSWSGIVALLLGTTLTLHASKLLGYVEVLADKALAASYGGWRAVLRGAVAEAVFTQLFDPLMALQNATMLPRLRRRAGWGAQNRDEQRVPWRVAARMFWWHTLTGVVLAVMFATVSAPALLVAMPALLGLLLAIPFCTLTTAPALSRWLVRGAVCVVPEERTVRPVTSVPELTRSEIGASIAPALEVV